MQYNVAQLLKEPTGSTRHYKLEESFAGAERIADTVHGRVHMLRTHQGVLVNADLKVEVTFTCSRCLGELALPYSLQIQEEFFPTIDIISGRRLRLPSGAEDALRIDASHTLDLGEAVRQGVISDAPMKPLCRPDCAGLCPVCGVNLNQEQCHCNGAPQDPRWAALAALLNQQKS